MKEIIKKNWFVAVVAVLFVCMAIFFAYDQNKDNLPGKKVNGKDVVFSIGGQNFTADDLYEEYYPSGSADAVYMLSQRLLLDQIVKTTDALEEEAAVMADQYYNYYSQYYGASTDAFIEVNMKAIGLESLKDYCLYNLKLQQMYTDYINKNLDTLYEPFAKEYKPRYVSHALVMMDDPKNPTAEEKDAFAEAKKAWESGEYTFAEFAKKFSDDTTSAVQEGSIGYVDKDSSLVKPFLDACLLLEEGQVSEWIESEYGYHLITVTSMEQAKIVEEPEFLEHILTFNANLENEVFWAELEAKNVNFNDKVVEQKIKEGLGLIKEEK